MPRIHIKIVEPEFPGRRYKNVDRFRASEHRHQSKDAMPPRNTRRHKNRESLNQNMERSM
jgi:hypothetical protein